MKPILLILAVFTLFLSACGSSNEQTTTEPETSAPETGGDEEVIAFVWSETGGCAMAGPNCARYEVTSLGAVSTYREGEDVAEVTGTIDAARVGQWMSIVDETDIDQLVAGLGPGEMTAAFDGVDFVLEAPYAELRLSSVDVGFDSGEALFQDAEQLALLAAKAAPLELKQR